MLYLLFILIEVWLNIMCLLDEINVVFVKKVILDDMGVDVVDFIVWVVLDVVILFVENSWML